MVNRTFMVGFAAILGIGFMLTPIEASAKSGGFGGGFKGSGGFKPFFHAKHFPSWRFRRMWGYGYPYGSYGDWGYGWPNYNSYDYVGYNDSALNAQPVGAQVTATRRVCNTETRTVPSEAGGERTITIRQCQSE